MNTITNEETVDRFVATAQEFLCLIEGHGSLTTSEFVRQSTLTLARLYSAALALSEVAVRIADVKDNEGSISSADLSYLAESV